MFGELSKSTLTVMGCLSALAITIILFSPTKLLRWLERKRYQYEVTFSLYMMTPTEKFIFSTFTSSPYPPPPHPQNTLATTPVCGSPSIHTRANHPPFLDSHSKIWILISRAYNRFSPLPLPLNGNNSRLALPPRTHFRNHATRILLRRRGL